MDERTCNQDCVVGMNDYASTICSEESTYAGFGQFVVENLVLTLVGAGVGFLVAAWVLSLVNASGLIAYTQLQVNYRVFGWGVLLAVGFGLLSGVYPAWRMSRLHPVAALRGGAQ